MWLYMISMAKMMEILNYGENLTLNSFVDIKSQSYFKVTIVEVTRFVFVTKRFANYFMTSHQQQL